MAYNKNVVSNVHGLDNSALIEELSRKELINNFKAKTEKLGTSLSQIPYHSLERVGRIFDEGANKYGKDNWKKGVDDKEYIEERTNHAIRHLMLWANGDRNEDHLAKVAWFALTTMQITMD